jgi:putative peptidoglycan lipid II flippase
MVAIQLPAFLRRLGPRRPGLPVRSAVTLAAIAPVAIFTLTRQAQVLIERFIGSSLPPGTISHLNYAQKVGQVPMVLAMVLTTVTFPALARTMAAGDHSGTRRRVEADLRTVTAVVLLAGAYLVAFAPAVVATLFQRGLFGPADTAATATILRVYVLGLLGHAFVGVLSRPFFSHARPTWYPAAAMAAGVGANAVLAAVLAGPWGAAGIAAANAAGISIAAVLLLGRARTRVPGLSPAEVGVAAGRLALPAAAAVAAGLLAAGLLAALPFPVVAVAGGPVVTAAFVAVAAVTDPVTVRAGLSTVKERSGHAHR